jgi:hypothetical protein
MKLRVLLYCLLGGLPMLMPAMGDGHAGWWYLSGVVMASAFVPIALFGPRKLLAQFGVIALTLLVVSALCTMSEAYFFFPKYHQQALRDLSGAIVMYFIVAVVLALLAVVLKLNRQSEHTVQHRGISGAVAMVLLSGFAYVLYYLVFGGITYQYFTKAYYPEGPQLVAQLGLWFWVMQLVRGVLMTLAVLPAIYTLRMGRMQSAIAIGALIWITGGLAPLLVPNVVMGPAQRMIHVVEIFTQNAPLGITAALLLRPKKKQASPQTGHVVAAMS